MKGGRTLAALGIWLASQLLAAAPYSVGLAIGGQEAAMPDTALPNLLAIGLLASQIIEILVFWGIRYFKPVETVRPFPGWLVLLVSLPLGFAVLYGVEILASALNVPDLMAEDLEQICSGVAGVLSVAVIGPISEEILMRRIVLRDMESLTGSTWAGILISAAIFAIIHINPAQVLFAFPAGVLLGWIYCKTGSLLVPICIHILNNSLSVLSLRMGWDDVSFAFDVETVLTLVACAVVSAVLVCWMNRRYPRLGRVSKTDIG
ncbi:MAG: CPBP family intramembrane metalloprotease [Bacteroidaceae bacterium]|nr:CPBP family intramembrane metalloprotease [Bacteroidaceae bacterium]